MHRKYVTPAQKEREAESLPLFPISLLKRNQLAVTVIVPVMPG